MWEAAEAAEPLGAWAQGHVTHITRAQTEFDKQAELQGSMETGAAHVATGICIGAAPAPRIHKAYNKPSASRHPASLR